MSTGVKLTGQHQARAPGREKRSRGKRLLGGSHGDVAGPLVGTWSRGHAQPSGRREPSPLCGAHSALQTPREGGWRSPGLRAPPPRLLLLASPPRTGWPAPSPCRPRRSQASENPLLARPKPTRPQRGAAAPGPCTHSALFSQIRAVRMTDCTGRRGNGARNPREQIPPWLTNKCPFQVQPQEPVSGNGAHPKPGTSPEALLSQPPANLNTASRRRRGPDAAEKAQALRAAGRERDPRLCLRKPWGHVVGTG